MKRALLAGVCLSALFTTHAFAEQAPARRPLIGGHGNDIEVFIAQHDGDSNGRLTWTEFDAFRRRRFDATDSGGDDVVDVEEYVQEFDDRMRQELDNARGGHVEQTGRRFAALDSDQDGGISRTEYAASGDKMFAQFQTLPVEGQKDTPAGARRRGDRLGMPTSHTREGFLALFDGNGDGKVDRAEFDQARAGQFAHTDNDGDGRLSQDEYLNEYEDRLDRRIATLSQGSDKQTRVRFGALDTDKNGKMAFAEYQVSGKRTFDRADRNHDGVVDAVDAQLPPPPVPARRQGARATGASAND